MDGGVRPGPQPTEPSDAVLIDRVIGALRIERRRGPSDFLIVLGLVIAIVAALLFALAVWIGDGVGRDVLVNLSTELVGALVTVVLIGGLLSSVERSGLLEIDALGRAFEARRGRGLSDAERGACRLLIEVHDTTAHAPPVIRQVEAAVFAVRHRAELRALDEMLAAGNTTRASDHA